MDKEYWYQKWQSNDIGFNQAQPNKHMQRYFSSLKISPGSRVFVPLCGQSIDMIWLIEQGYEVVGVEISEIACRNFFNENKIPVTITRMKDFIVYRSQKIIIFCGDFFKINQRILDKIDVVYDRAALIAMPFDARKSYSEHLMELMESAKLMFLITIKYKQKEMQGPPFSVGEEEVSTLYSARFDIEQLFSKKFSVPLHLSSKGLHQCIEQVYVLTPTSLHR